MTAPYSPPVIPRRRKRLPEAGYAAYLKCTRLMAEIHKSVKRPDGDLVAEVLQLSIELGEAAADLEEAAEAANDPRF